MMSLTMKKLAFIWIHPLFTMITDLGGLEERNMVQHF